MLLVAVLAAVAVVGLVVFTALDGDETPAKPAASPSGASPSASPSSLPSPSKAEDPSKATELGIDREWPEELVYPSERSFKADQIEALSYTPRVVFFGGSRSVRFDPAYLEKKTGIKGFNLAMTNGKPEDAWAFAHFLHKRAPKTKTVWIWGVQTSTLYTRDLEPGLVQDPRLSRYLPTSLLDEQAALLPTDPAEIPPTGRVANRRYSPEGMVVYNPYDAARKRGVTLERSLRAYLNRALPKLSAAPPSTPKDSRSRDYFEKTLGLLNSYGDTPIVMAMPVQPEVLAAFREHGWQERQDRFLEYLDGLHQKYDFRLIDLTDIKSFDGDPHAFYDGVHIDAKNARRATDELVKRFPDLFDELGGG